jgi:hypothetical protein
MDTNTMDTNTKKKIESDAIKKVCELYNSPKDLSKNVLKNLQKIMEDGSKEFKANTGREMTYSEMREMYG